MGWAGEEMERQKKKRVSPSNFLKAGLLQYDIVPDKVTLKATLRIKLRKRNHVEEIAKDQARTLSEGLKTD